MLIDCCFPFIFSCTPPSLSDHSFHFISPSCSRSSLLALCMGIRYPNRGYSCPSVVIHFAESVSPLQLPYNCFFYQSLTPVLFLKVKFGTCCLQLAPNILLSIFRCTLLIFPYPKHARTNIRIRENHWHYASIECVFPHIRRDKRMAESGR